MKKLQELGLLTTVLSMPPLFTDMPHHTVCQGSGRPTTRTKSELTPKQRKNRNRTKSQKKARRINR